MSTLSKGRISHTLVWYTQQSTLSGIVANIEKCLNHPGSNFLIEGTTDIILGADLLKKEVKHFEVHAGQPHCDYGQTVTMKFSIDDSQTTDFNNPVFKGKLLIGS